MSKPKHQEPITDMYDLLDAIEAVIETADQQKRQALAETIDAYHGDFPEDFHWAISGQAPMLLHHLIVRIDAVCHVPAKRRSLAVSLSNRTPAGTA